MAKKSKRSKKPVKAKPKAAHHKPRAASHKPVEITQETWNKVFVIVAGVLIIGIMAGVGSLMQNVSTAYVPTTIGPGATYTATHTAAEAEDVAKTALGAAYMSGQIQDATFEQATGEWTLLFELTSQSGDSAEVEVIVNDADLKISRINFIIPVPEIFEDTGVGNIQKTEAAAIMENGKPVVFEFSTTGCPHCMWERPIFVKVTSKFGTWSGFDEVAYGKALEAYAVDDLATQFNALDAAGFRSMTGATYESEYLVAHMVELDEARDHEAVFSRFNPGGGVPSLVFGGTYVQAGSGERFGAEAEENYLTAVMCKLTENAIDECSTPEISALVAQL